MGQICLDTDIIIEFLKGKKEIVYMIQQFDSFSISIITVYEFMRGFDEEKLKYINHLDLNYEIMVLAASIYKKLKKEGSLIQDNDIIIGACCIINNIPLLTLNKKHFEKLKRFGLKVV